MVYQRWYDYDVRLSAVVRSMEFMSSRNRQYFAEKLLELSRQLLVERGGEAYFETLHPKKKEGLEKAENRKRWYDQDETLHDAFKNLYALSAEDRREVASRFTTPILIVEAYEKYCQQEEKEPDIKVVEDILRTCLAEGQERAKQLYAIYRMDFAAPIESPRNEQPAGLWSGLLKNLQGFLSATGS